MASPTELYVQWRAGDPHAAQELARRFTDWYQAIAQARLGPDHAAGPFARACSRFQGGILKIRNPIDLVPWAHGLIVEELNREDDGAAPTDVPAARLEALDAALAALPGPSRALLLVAYAPGSASLTELAAPLGGLPFALAEARDALKAALAARGERFPDAGVVPDHAPLPYYEAGRASPEEASAIETWLLSDPVTCRDLVAFAPWSQALRARAALLPATASPNGRVSTDVGAQRPERIIAPPADERPFPWVWIAVGGLVLAAVLGGLLLG